VACGDPALGQVLGEEVAPGVGPEQLIARALRPGTGRG